MSPYRFPVFLCQLLHSFHAVIYDWSPSVSSNLESSFSLPSLAACTDVLLLFVSDVCSATIQPPNTGLFLSVHLSAQISCMIGMIESMERFCFVLSI